MKRTAEIQRKTKETAVELSLNLDGTRTYSINTGIGFLDHMLELFAFHGKLDLQLSCEGDTKVDAHHSIEDTAIVLGQAIKEALGDKIGIVRYATNYLPMDETLCRTSLDIGGRFYHIFEADFKGSFVGGFPLEMTEHFFYALSQQSVITLHQKILYGKNNHHKVEALFKSFAYALKDATRLSGKQIFSSKGVL